VGIAVFALWIAPELLWPDYRSHWLFTNSITGPVSSSVEPVHRDSLLVLVFRTIRAAVLVPIIEELFWRAWLMRWLIRPDIQSVPLGAWTASSMLISVILFASEHGPYWDVGLIAGLIYNLLMIRTKSLGDCILAHGVTNGILSAYVIASGQWHYWG
jgi:CAAX prenyl protease-like protein